MRGPDSEHTERARQLRKAQTQAEAQLWRRLRNRGLNGFKFSRQEPIGLYFGDFVCRERMLIVEADGATHLSPVELQRDAQRTHFLESKGYSVLRFVNAEIYENLIGVLETILAKLEGRDTL